MGNEDLTGLFKKLEELHHWLDGFVCANYFSSNESTMMDFTYVEALEEAIDILETYNKALNKEKQL